MFNKTFRAMLVILAASSLTACRAVLLSPSGDLAKQQRDLIGIASGLMLLIIVPVIVLTLYFAWHYRAGNRKARHDPDWDHSTSLELLIWSAPLLIIIALGAVTWVSTHKLDPFRPLERLSPGRPLPVDSQPLEIQAIALDWKWLFIYPEQGVATVNELAVPVDRPVKFHITAATVMNSFFVPAVAGQIYAMPGMSSILWLVVNRPGAFDGISANYSGDGFSGMHFVLHGMNEADYRAWLKQMKQGGAVLDRAHYDRLAKPSANEPVHHYAAVVPGLYDAVLERCFENGQLCPDDGGDGRQMHALSPEHAVLAK